MKLSDIVVAFEGGGELYELLEVRKKYPHVFVVLCYKLVSGALAKYTLAFTEAELAENAELAVANHLAIAVEDIERARHSTSGLPTWG